MSVVTTIGNEIS